MSLCYFKTPALCKNLVENTAKAGGGGGGAEQPEPGADCVSGSQVIGASCRPTGTGLLTTARLTRSGPIRSSLYLLFSGPSPHFPHGLLRSLHTRQHVKLLCFWKHTRTEKP